MTDQAQAVYAAEDLWMARDPQPCIKFGDWDEVWPFYYKLTEALKANDVLVSMPKVKARKGALKAHYDSSTSTVFIPPYKAGGVWALNTGVAIHEYAHHLSTKGGHGPEFRLAMITILEAIHWDADLLIRCYEEVGLTTSTKGDGITDKVGKLLTHADKAATDEERRTYIEKAEGLAAQHSINLALIRKKKADANDDRERPITGELFSLAALPTVTHRNLAVELGNAIAHAHGAQCAVRGKSMYLTFYGFSEDVLLTQLMLTRLSPMMFEEADRYTSSAEHKATGVSTVSARITFCKNFSWEVSARLRKAVEETQETMSQDDTVFEEGETSTEIAIREKALEVADYVGHQFRKQGIRGTWKGSKTKNWNASAADAGRTSAQQANLFGRQELV